VQVRDPAVEEGDYTLQLDPKQKLGTASWPKKAGKYPGKWVAHLILGSALEEGGKDRMVRIWLSTSPDSLFQVENMANAYGYPEAIPAIVLPNGPNDPASKGVTIAIDKILQWIKESGSQARAHVVEETYQNRPQNKIGDWLPAAEGEGAPVEGEAAPEEEVQGDDQGVEASGDEQPAEDVPAEEDEVPPPPPARAAAPKNGAAKTNGVAHKGPAKPAARPAAKQQARR
jgi:hypothetical protein